MQVHYYFQLAQQQSNEAGSSQSSGPSMGSPTTVQVIQPGTGQIQTVTLTGQSQDQVNYQIERLKFSSR